jgi:hypothetical protein
MVITACLLIGWYVFVAGLLFRTWLGYADRDITMTQNQQILSWFMLLISTAFWGITLPLTYLELLKKRSPISEKVSSEKSMSNIL